MSDDWGNKFFEELKKQDEIPDKILALPNRMHALLPSPVYEQGGCGAVEFIKKAKVDEDYVALEYHNTCMDEFEAKAKQDKLDFLYKLKERIIEMAGIGFITTAIFAEIDKLKQEIEG